MLVRFNRTAAMLSAMTASLIVAASPAVAQGGPSVVYGVPKGTNMVLVRYGDLNLNANAHRNILYGRVGRAVRYVCDFGSVGFSTDYQYCSRSSWASARPQMYRAFARAYQSAYIRR